MIEQSKARIPDEWRRKYAQNRTLEELRGDANLAFDRLWAMEREKDRQDKELGESKEQLKWAKRLIIVMSLIVSPVLTECVKWGLRTVFAK